MSVKVTERTITHPDGTVRVGVATDGAVAIRPQKTGTTWLFTPSDLKDALGTLDMMSEHEGVTVKLADSNGKTFTPRFHAEMIEFRWGTLSDRVDYDEFRRVARRAIKKQS